MKDDMFACTYVVVNKDLHKLYEKLTDNPFIPQDHRPMLACFLCCTKLKQCCRFQRQCREAEELLALMLDEDYESNSSINPGYLEFFNGFLKTPGQNMSIVDENKNLSTAVKEELPDVCEKLDGIMELDEEQQCYSYNEPELDSENSYSDVEYKPALHFESDSEDDVVSRKKRRADKKRAPVAKKSKLRTPRIKPEDVVIKEGQNTYQQSESKVIRAKVKNSRSVNNTTLATSVCDVSDNDDNKCKISNKFSNTDDVNEHQRLKVKEKRFKCDICQRGFRQKGHLTTHIRIHTGEKRYECGICQIAFTRVDILYKHMHRHTGEKPFKCETCKRRFNQKANLNRHILIHTGEKPYKCNLCQYSCIQKADLKKHIRIHTDEKPYKCDLCQYGCNQKGVLTLHILRKHPTCK